MQKALLELYQEKKRTMQEVLDSFRSGDVIFTTNNYSEPGEILSHLHEIAPRVENLKVWKGRSGLYPFMVDPSMKGHIEMYNYFFGPTFYRNSLPMGLVDYVPTDLQSYFTVAVNGHPGTVYITASTPMDENGNFVKPEAPNCYKFELLVLDMVHMMEDCLPYEVDRAREFAPIKNPTGIDSVESARELCKRDGIVL